jgi:hypothetical protein
MNAFEKFAIVSSVLLSCSGVVVLSGWQVLCYQPTGTFVLTRSVNWKPMIKVANDKIFDLKVEAGVIPPPTI